MTWVFEPARERFDAFRVQWDQINRRYHRGNPLLDSRFVGALIERFGTGAEVLCQHRAGNGNGNGNDALLIATRKDPYRWSLFLPSQAQIAPFVCGKPDAVFSLLPQLPGLAISFDLLAQDEAYSCAAPVATAHDRLTRSEHALTINVDLTMSFKQYWDSRPRGLRQNVGRYFRRAQAEKRTLRMAVAEAPEEMEAAVRRYGDLESSGWKAKIGTAVHAENSQGQFYAQALRAFATDGEACVYELYLGARLAASRLCIGSSESLIMLKTTYDETLSALAPGRLLLYLVLERELGLKRFKTLEFYTNATPDQCAWSTNQRRIFHLTLYRNAWLRQANDLRRTLGAALRSG